MSQTSRITPLPENEAHSLIQKYYLHGRKVSYHPPEESWLEPHKREFGTVTGTGKKIVHRGGLNDKLAGCYLDFTKLRIVREKDGTELLLDINCPDLGPFFTEGKSPEWPNRNDMQKMANIYIRISNLPDTPFWEGDTVGINNIHIVKGSHEVENNSWVISEIDYNYLGRGAIYCEAWNQLSDGTIDKLHSCKLPIEWFILQERGNLWKMEHGEPIEFASIEEGAKFHQSLGMSQNVTRLFATEQIEHASAMEFRNASQEENFHASMTATFAEAIQALRDGKADEMKLKDKVKMTFVLIKYDAAEFGARLRAHTLAKFGLGE